MSRIAPQKNRALERLPASVSTIHRWAAALLWFRRQIYGKRKHPLLGIGQAEMSDLISMGCPCRLVFDASRGGRVNDPALARHPKSEVKEHEDDPLALPDHRSRIKTPVIPVSLYGMGRFSAEPGTPYPLASLLPGRTLPSQPGNYRGFEFGLLGISCGNAIFGLPSLTLNIT